MSEHIHSGSWQDFLQICAQLDEADSLDQFFNLFLTQEEVKAVAGRYRIIRALLKGEGPQRAMAEKLDVSIAKITRGSNALKRIDPELREWLMKIL